MPVIKFSKHSWQNKNKKTMGNFFRLQIVSIDFEPNVRIIWLNDDKEQKWLPKMLDCLWVESNCVYILCRYICMAGFLVKRRQKLNPNRWKNKTNLSPHFSYSIFKVSEVFLLKKILIINVGFFNTNIYTKNW